MSDPVTNVEIEDVLSSIRRLVSEDARAGRSRTEARQAPPERLVLTPSLRVHDGQGAAPGAGDAPGQGAPEAAGPQPALPRAERLEPILLTNPAEAPPEAAAPASVPEEDEEAPFIAVEDERESAAPVPLYPKARALPEAEARVRAMLRSEAAERSGMEATEGRETPDPAAPEEPTAEPASQPAGEDAAVPQRAEDSPSAPDTAEAEAAPSAPSGASPSDAAAEPAPVGAQPRNRPGTSGALARLVGEEVARAFVEEITPAQDRAETGRAAPAAAPEAQGLDAGAQDTLTDLAEIPARAPQEARAGEADADSPEGSERLEARSDPAAQAEDQAEPQARAGAEPAPEWLTNAVARVAPMTARPAPAATLDSKIAALEALVSRQRAAAPASDRATFISRRREAEPAVSAAAEPEAPQPEATPALLADIDAALPSGPAEPAEDREAGVIEAGATEPRATDGDATEAGAAPEDDVATLWLSDDEEAEAPAQRFDAARARREIEAESAALDLYEAEDAEALDGDTGAEAARALTQSGYGALSERTEALEIDEALLRQMVSDIVRQELQGVLGERITRNVRKLVRREIHRVVMSQEFD
jgi:hypothetical protein